MKYLLFILLGVFSTCVFSQNKSYLTDDDWSKIIKNLNNENWDSANKTVEFFLNKYSNEDTNNVDAERLRYMFILSEAGMLNENKIDKEKALDAVKNFIGLKVILPGHQFSLKRGFNVIQPINNNTDTLFITATNKQKTQIFSFEYVIPDKKMTMSEFSKNINSVGTIEGVLYSIIVEGHLLPRYKIFIKHASMDISSEDR